MVSFLDGMSSLRASSCLFLETALHVPNNNIHQGEVWFNKSSKETIQDLVVYMHVYMALFGRTYFDSG